MLLTPTELERLTIFSAAELARRRRNRGRKLNAPEAIALISDEILEMAHDGHSVAEQISHGSKILNTDDVVIGVKELIPILQVEATFPDGTKLVTVHDPIRLGELPLEKDRVIPGEIRTATGVIEINEGRKKINLQVINTGDRPVQIGSHYHFFETNKALDFDRSAAFGFRLDIPAGTAVRFEPGQERTIELVALSGRREVFGFRGMVMGSVGDSK